jgi:geranylgeranyl pyrophosphate synthase
LPIAKAMGRLSKAGRAQLWQTLQSRPTDPIVLSSTVALLESCGAITACSDEAAALVESAWSRAAPLLPDSLFKVVLRAFGWYVLQRHY